MERPLLVIVSGSPASGKSTLAAQLASDFGLPLFSKDLLKEALFDTLGAADRERSRELSVAAYRLLYTIAARLLSSGLGVVLESNFVRGRSEEEILPLLARSRGVLLHCQVSREEIARRYQRRVVTAERHPGHHDVIAMPEVLAGLDRGIYAPLALDIPMLTLDTTDGYRPEDAAILAFIRTQGLR